MTKPKKPSVRSYADESAYLYGMSKLCLERGFHALHLAYLIWAHDALEGGEIVKWD